jgi:Uncharacterized conserved protein (DUF2190)
MADKQINNPTGAFPLLSTGDTLAQELWQEAAPSQASTTVTAGRVVAINTLGQVAAAATNGTASLCIGVALNDITANNSGLIICQGYASGFPDGAIAAGDVLKRSVNTAGYVATTATPGVGESIGVAIAASASGRVDMWVSKGA